MKGEILDTINENASTCYLVRCKLSDYIISLSDDYQRYDIQREVVTNTFLDNLINTILEMGHIPLIVLVAEKNDLQIINQKNGLQEITLKKFKILDGLQRTHRLKVIYDTIELIKRELKYDNSVSSLTRLEISKRYKEELESIYSSTSLFTTILNTYNKNNRKNFLNELFDKGQWFEVWTDLAPEKEVSKMLVLNAGHKAVKTKHQLELLFLNIIPILKKLGQNNFEIIREKELSSTKYSKNRTVGQYHFSQLITSILSFSEGTPLTTNVMLIQKAQQDELSDDLFKEYLQYDFLENFIATLLTLDEALFAKYGEIGLKWIGRETSLVGIFAAAGKLVKIKDIPPLEALRIINEKICKNPGILRLNEFEKQRNSLNLAKVNIGTINKRAVFNGVYEILTGTKHTISWEEQFNTSN